MLVELKNISKSYEEKIIFNKYNFRLEDGEMVAIVGDSGTGKTTLINIIGGLDDADDGQICIGKYTNPYRNKKLKEKIYREYIGFLFQNYALIENYTVYENLELATKYVAKGERKKLCEEALLQVGLSDKHDVKVYKLSGGEQQRVALARLMVKPNKLILADEPTGALDADNRDNVMKILREMNKLGKGVIIVTHDMFVANQCDRIVKL